MIDLQELRESLRPDTILVSMMYVNNEIGAVEPVEEIAARLSDRSSLPGAVSMWTPSSAYGKYAHPSQAPAA